MLARRRNLMLARARRAVGRKGRVALAGALTGAGKFLSNKAQNYVRRKLTNKKSSFQNVKVEGNGGQVLYLVFYMSIILFQLILF